MRTITILVVLAIALSGADAVATLTGNFWFGAALFAALFGGFIIQGLRQVPAQPPTKGVLTILGRRQPKIIKEGWNFFPFYPWLTGYIPIEVTKVNRDVKPENVRTPDLAELSVPVSLTWTPGIDSEWLDRWVREDPDGVEDREQFRNPLISYLNAGGKDGVGDILDDMVAERVRQWLLADAWPKTWDEAIKAQDAMIQQLAVAIAGELLPPEGEERNRHLTRLRRGNGAQPLPSLGITLNRLNVTEIKALGEVAKVAESEAREKQERRGEMYEVTTDLMKASQLVGAAAAIGQPLTMEGAFRIIMEWKATREGRGFTIPGLSADMAEAVLRILGRR